VLKREFYEENTKFLFKDSGYGAKRLMKESCGKNWSLSVLLPPL